MKDKAKKDSVINFRVSQKQKMSIQSDAMKYGMNVAEYLLYLVQHKNVIVISGGKELAEAIYDLNRMLDKYETLSFIPVQELRDSVSKGIEKINLNVKEGIRDVNIEI